MHTEAPCESLLRQACEVPGVGRTFEPMKKYKLAPCGGCRLMLEDQDAVPIVCPVYDPLGRKTSLVDAARPEIARDCRQMGVSEKRLEI